MKIVIPIKRIAEKVANTYKIMGEVAMAEYFCLSKYIKANRRPPCLHNKPDHPRLKK